MRLIYSLFPTSRCVLGCVCVSFGVFKLSVEALIWKGISMNSVFFWLRSRRSPQICRVLLFAYINQMISLIVLGLWHALSVFVILNWCTVSGGRTLLLLSHCSSSVYFSYLSGFINMQKSFPGEYHIVLILLLLNDVQCLFKIPCSGGYSSWQTRTVTVNSFQSAN